MYDRSRHIIFHTFLIFSAVMTTVGASPMEAQVIDNTTTEFTKILWD